MIYVAVSSMLACMVSCPLLLCGTEASDGNKDGMGNGCSASLGQCVNARDREEIVETSS